MRTLICIEVEIETDYVPSSREEWVIADAIEKAALRVRMPKGARITKTMWPINGATKPLKFEKIGEQQ